MMGLNIIEKAIAHFVIALKTILNYYDIYHEKIKSFTMFYF